MSIPVYLVVALQAEATPVIEKYKLKAVCRGGPFKYFVNKDIELVVSGMGRINAAAATAAVLQGRDNLNRSIIVNIGIAGHQSLKIASVFVAHKITQCALSNSWYPPIDINTPLKTSALETIDKPSGHYPPNTAFDMEAAGFYAIAIRYIPAELIQVVKVVSDNPDNPLQDITKQLVSGLIKNAMDEIDLAIKSLTTLAKIQYDDSAVMVLQKKCEDKFRFRLNQINNFHSLLIRYSSLYGELPEFSALENEANQSQPKLASKAIIHLLETAIKQKAASAT